MLALRSKWSVTGYGYYMMILEMMREQSNFMLEHCLSTTRALAYEFRINESEVTDYLNDCADAGLFCISDDFIWSESFVKRMEKMTKKEISRSEKAKKAANARWNKDNDAKPMHKQCTSNATAMLNDANKIRLDKITSDKIKDIVDKSPTIIPKYPADNKYYKTAIYFRGKMLEYNPKCKVPAETVKALHKWADVFRKIFELDNRTGDDLRLIMGLLDGGGFWQGVVQSPVSLRKHWDKIYLQAKQGGSNGKKTQWQLNKEMLERE